MADPRRLRSASGSWEALLLRSAPSLEPPPSAQEEVWRRLEIVSAVGVAAGATDVAAHAAASAGSKMIGKGIWLAALKWGAVVAIGVPAVGVTARVVMHRETRDNHVAVSARTPSPAVEPANAIAAGGPAPDSSPTAAAPAEPVVADVPRHASPPRAGHTAARAESTLSDAPSALRAESLRLGVARAKLATGDPRGALEDVAQLGVQFPHGALVQEREVLAVDCLAAMGDRQGMRARARAFLERFPGSPYSAHLRPLLER